MTLQDYGDRPAQMLMMNANELKSFNIKAGVHVRQERVPPV